MKLAIVIFRNNLRIDDNHCLNKACNENDYILGLYSLELLKDEIFGFKKCDIFREKLIKESLICLRKNLLKYNINLSIVDNIEQSLEELAQSYEITIYYDEEVGTEERAFEKRLQKYPYQSFFSQTMIEPFTFDYKKSFSHFRNRAEKLEVPKPLDKISRKKTIEFKSLDIQIPTI